jgi:RNA polymerase sigma-70 factor (ECF subfamily)
MTTPSHEPRPRDSAGLTSFHVRRAERGDGESLGWVVTRFSPILLANASWLLGPELRRLHDPEDLVGDAWTVVLPRLDQIATDDGRCTPVLLRFLTTAIRYRVNNLLRKHIRGAPEEKAPRREPSWSGIAASVTDAFEAAARSELRTVIEAAIDELEPGDREVLFLRGIEQHPNHVVATLLATTPQATSMRFRRALDRLRVRLPESILDEIGEAG